MRHESAIISVSGKVNGADRIVSAHGARKTPYVMLYDIHSADPVVINHSSPWTTRTDVSHSLRYLSVDRHMVAIDFVYALGAAPSGVLADLDRLSDKGRIPISRLDGVFERKGRLDGVRHAAEYGGLDESFLDPPDDAATRVDLGCEFGR